MAELPEFEEEDESDRIPDEDEAPVETEGEAEIGAEAVPERRDDEAGGRNRRRRRRRRGEEGQPEDRLGDAGRDEEGRSEIAGLIAEQRPIEAPSEELRADHEEAAIPSSAEADGESGRGGGGDTREAARSEAARIEGIEAERKRRRRGRRGGRRRRRGTPGQEGLGLEGPAVEGQAPEAQGSDDGDYDDHDRDGHEDGGYGLDEHERFAEDPAALGNFGLTVASEPVAEAGEPHLTPSIAETVEIVPLAPSGDNAATSIEAAFSPPQAAMAQTDVEIASVPVGEHGDREEIFVEPVAASAAPAPVAVNVPARATTQPVEEERHPVQYNIPEPHEVTGPPANPRRGWWRR